MKISRRAGLVILLVGLLLLLGYLSASFLQDYLIMPMALVVALCWRIVQSVDQMVYWTILVLGILGSLFVRLLIWLQEPTDLEQPSAFGTNTTLERISYWQNAIRFAGRQTSSNILEQDLGKLLATVYASKQPEAVQFQVYDALKGRQIPLPEPVYAFLFPPESVRSRRSLKQILASLRDWRRKRLRRWTGRETDEYYQALESVITFMETSLETRHDDEHFDPAHH